MCDTGMSVPLFSRGGVEPRGGARGWLSATPGRKPDLGAVAAVGQDRALSALGRKRPRTHLAARGKIGLRHARFRDVRFQWQADGCGRQRVAALGYDDKKAATGGQTNLGNSKIVPGSSSAGAGAAKADPVRI